MIAIGLPKSSFTSRMSRTKWFGVGLFFFSGSILRSWNSIHHLIPDPGLQFQITAWSDGPFDIFGSYGGYPQIAPRVISKFLNLVPIAQLTYWSTLATAAITAICALAITISLVQTINPWIAGLSGLSLAIAFPAYESLIGNIWAIRWILLPTTCIIVATEFAKQHWRFAFLLFLITGLSHAYIVIPAGIFLWRIFFERDRSPRMLLLGFVLVSTTTFQGLAFLLGSRQSRLYGEATVYWPWPGSGIYWLAIFVVPIGFAFASMIFNLLNSGFNTKLWSPSKAIAFQAILLAVLSYLQLGIKSSAAVTTVTVSYIALIISTNDGAGITTRINLNKIVAIGGSFILLLLCARYYFASPYITFGTRWSETVGQALDNCQVFGTREVNLIYFKAGDLINSEVLGCDALKNWNKWFFHR
jgi:hypothetical protein